MLHGENIIRYRDLKRILLLLLLLHFSTEYHLAHVVSSIKLRDILDNEAVHSFMLLNADPGVGDDDGVSGGQDVKASPPDNVPTI